MWFCLERRRDVIGENAESPERYSGQRRKVCSSLRRPLFKPQCHERIHSRRAPRGDKAGQDRDQQQHGRRYE